MTTSTIQWSTFHRELGKFIHKRISNPFDAEDVLQDVLLKAYLKQDQLCDSAKMRSWLYQIARNAIIDYYRTRKHLNVPIDDWAETLTQQTDSSPERDALVDCVVKMIDHLPEKYRHAVFTADIQQVPQYELSNALGLSYSGAKSRVQRGREKLRDLIEDACGVEVNDYQQAIYAPKSQAYVCCA